MTTHDEQTREDEWFRRRMNDATFALVVRPSHIVDFGPRRAVVLAALLAISGQMTARREPGAWVVDVRDVKYHGLSVADVMEALVGIEGPVFLDENHLRVPDEVLS